MTILLLALLLAPQGTAPHPCAVPSASPVVIEAGVGYALTFCSADTSLTGYAIISDGMVRPPVDGPLLPTGAPSAAGRYPYRTEAFVLGAGVHTVGLAVRAAVGWSAPSVPVIVVAKAAVVVPPPPPPPVDRCVAKPSVLTTSYWPSINPGAAITVVAREEGWQKATFTRLPNGRFSLEVIDDRGCLTTLTK